MNKFELISAIESGDTNKVMAVLYKEEYPNIEKYIVRNSGTRKDALDVFKEAVIALITHIQLKKFNPEFEIGSFLYAVAYNRWKNRMANTSTAIEELPEKYNGINEIESLQNIYTEESRNFISAIFSNIESNCREMLGLSSFILSPQKDLAELSGYENEDSLKNHVYKCKKQLITLINEKPDNLVFIKEYLMHHDG